MGINFFIQMDVFFLTSHILATPSKPSISKVRFAEKFMSESYSLLPVKEI